MTLSLIVENGSMVNNANSFVDVQFVDTYQQMRGNTTWPEAPAPPEEDPNNDIKVISIIKATDYLNGLNWSGRKYYPDQIMAWPRNNASNSYGIGLPCNIVPMAVKYASCYLAGLIYSGIDIQPVLERGGRIQAESVGSISTSYFEDAPNRDIFTVLADLLHEICYDFRGYNGPSANKNKTVILDIMSG
jgi:hypothetical protein